MLSVVVPIYNEQENLTALRQRLADVFDTSDFAACEAILVSDGSVDESEAMIRKMAGEDARFRGVFLTRNFGHQAAVTVGLEHARGSVIAVIDGDLQDPPEAIGELIAALEAGADVAYGVRRARKESALKRAAYWMYYRVLRAASSTEIPLDAGDFCAMRRPVLEAMRQLPERRRFVRGLRAWVGFTQVGVEYERDARHAGAPKYSLMRLARLAYDGIFSFSSVPVKLMQLLGFTAAGLAILVSLVYLTWSFFKPMPAGFPTLMLSIWFLGGVQLMCLGLIGEYAYRTFDEARRRPSALVREVTGGLDGRADSAGERSAVQAAEDAQHESGAHI